MTKGFLRPLCQSLAASGFPTRWRPNFDPVQDGDKHDFRAQFTFFSKSWGQAYPTLAVHRAVFGSRENGVMKELGFRIERIPLGNWPLDSVDKMGGGETPDSTIEECEHNCIDSCFLQLSTKPCRKGDATLVIELYGDLTPLSEHPTSHDRPVTTQPGAACTAFPPYSTLPHIQPI
jgi:hypothetical protein